MRKSLTLLALIMIAATLNAQNFRKIRKAAEAFVESGKYEDAVEQYTHAIQLKPTDIDMYLERGKAYEAMELYDEAYSDYEKAHVFDPKEPEVLYLLGRVSNKMEKYDQALAHLNRASAVAKRESKIYPEKVWTLLQLEEYEQALKVSDTAMLFDEDALNYYQRGLAYESLNNDILAKKDFENSVRKDKRFDDARLALANLLVRTGSLDDAMAHCTAVLEYNDRSTDAYLTRSRIFIKQLDYPSAINDVSRNILIES
ncbi:MAG: tetratricopeptide repeat protein [Bacteroidales bacterium]|nr:tetratricopeptide repeat protein [Bacteroidales bacterium]